jgi:hypothetical protein
MGQQREEQEAAEQHEIPDLSHLSWMPIAVAAEEEGAEEQLIQAA